MNKGQLLQCGTLDELISIEIRYVDLVWSTHSDALIKYLKTFDGRVSVSKETLYCKLEPKQNEHASAFEGRVNEIVQKGMSMGGRLQSVSPKKENLEDVFVRQVGHLESRV
jgi:ABC-type multidrug transport system ATPase subunit